MNFSIEVFSLIAPIGIVITIVGSAVYLVIETRRNQTKGVSST